MELLNESHIVAIASPEEQADFGMMRVTAAESFGLTDGLQAPI